MYLGGYFKDEIRGGKGSFKRWRNGICQRDHKHNEASPRAMLALIRASQAKAYLAGRDFVKPDDVKAVTVNVLHHRLSLTSEAKMRRESVDRLLTGLVLKAKIPME